MASQKKERSYNMYDLEEHFPRLSVMRGRGMGASTAVLDSFLSTTQHASIKTRTIRDRLPNQRLCYPLVFDTVTTIILTVDRAL